MRKYAITLPLVLVFAVMMTACGRPPQAEMDMARADVMRAENTPNAVTYAANTLSLARTALVRMEEEAGARRFDAARTLAMEASALAERAISEGSAAAFLAREEAAALVSGLGAPIQDATNALNAARQAGTVSLDFDVLSWDLDWVRRNYNDARQSLEDNDYQTAIAHGQNARALLADVNARINDAAQLLARK